MVVGLSWSIYLVKNRLTEMRLGSTTIILRYCLRGALIWTYSRRIYYVTVNAQIKRVARYRWIADIIHAICNYVMKYATKSEESSKQGLIDELKADQNIHALCRQLGRLYYALRDMGAFEAAAVLLGLPFYGRSTQVDWVSLGFKSSRSVKMVTKSDLAKLAELDPESTKNYFHENNTNDFYPKRPKSLENMCLHDFLSKYTRLTEEVLVNLLDIVCIFHRLESLSNHDFIGTNEEATRWKDLDQTGRRTWCSQIDHHGQTAHSQMVQLLFEGRRQTRRALL